MVPDLSGMTAKEAEKALKGMGLAAVRSGAAETVTAQIPAAGQTVPGGSQVLLYFGEEPAQRTVKVPDFTGMNRQQASDAAGKLGLYILATGNNGVSSQVTVTAQSIPKDTPVAIGTTIQLEFTDTRADD